MTKTQIDQAFDKYQDTALAVLKALDGADHADAMLALIAVLEDVMHDSDREFERLLDWVVDCLTRLHELNERERAKR